MAAGLLAAYALLMLARPPHLCFRCWGKNHRVIGTRAKPCRDCRLTGRQLWPARPVHRLF